ncbi:MAG: cell division protein ZapA [Gammaproteobacteria bacterium]|nr:cell division protein ZapA [Gammaproteobacteria bacterium]NNC97629.1 cell division protein ZapA [Gammaproteobacteria bacterium]NNM14185.1 cell division protein ZapA [Gammaproteobacteria bacterium]
MSNLSKIKIKILEKEYDIACPPEERTELLDSAELLNTRMRDIRDSGKVIGLDRIAVMSALNLAHEVVRLKASSGQLNEEKDSEVTARLRSIRDRIQTALGDPNKALDL